MTNRKKVRKRGVNMRHRTTLIPVLTVLATMIALASVFVYYPLEITAAPQAPGVVFETGSNADKPDIGTTTIKVTIGKNGTSASVEIHPTYQENYYKDVLRVKNGDNDAMRVFLIFDSVTNQLPSGSVVKIFVYDGTTKVRELDITNPDTGTAISIGSLNVGATWQIDFYVKIPEGYSITNKEYKATARLVYTPSTGETPPGTPSSGR